MNGYIKLRSLRRDPLRTAICAVMFLMAHDPESTFLAKTWPAYGAIEAERIANHRCPGCGETNGGTHFYGCPELPPQSEIDRIEAFVASIGKAIVPNKRPRGLADELTYYPPVNESISGDGAQTQNIPREPLTDAELAVVNDMIEELRAKPKRIRVRGKPLTVADIVEGGVYVPKRGNDKTPNYIVQDAAFSPGGTLVGVHYGREGRENEGFCSYADFLALASRRVDG